jgi:hypothetical protein
MVFAVSEATSAPTAIRERGASIQGGPVNGGLCRSEVLCVWVLDEAILDSGDATWYPPGCTRGISWLSRNQGPRRAALEKRR